MKKIFMLICVFVISFSFNACKPGKMKLKEIKPSKITIIPWYEGFQNDYWYFGPCIWVAGEENKLLVVF